MELRTYTSIFRLERKLYKVFDMELPRPVSLPQAGAFAIAFLAMFALSGLLGIAVTPASAWLFVVVPGAAAWAASTAVADGKRPHELALSYLRFALEPRYLDGLAERREPEILTFASPVQVRRPAP